LALLLEAIIWRMNFLSDKTCMFYELRDELVHAIQQKYIINDWEGLFVCYFQQLPDLKKTVA
jgi:hypothetical protein